MPHLAVQRIAKSYDGNPAVRDISFEVAPGRVLALCGENGAGKSTLMRMLSGATRPGQRRDPASTARRWRSRGRRTRWRSGSAPSIRS